MEKQTSFNAQIKKNNQDILIMQFKNILKTWRQSCFYYLTVNLLLKEFYIFKR